MGQLSDLVEGVQIGPIALLDIVLTALIIYGIFGLIQGTRAVRLVIGAIIIYVLYVVAQALDLRLLSWIMETGAVVGVLALVVIFQPELRRGLDRLGRVGTLGLALVPSDGASAHRMAGILARTATSLAAQRVGALVVIERETGLEDMAESGVMLHADLSTELLSSIFTPHSPLHDGAVVVRGERIVAAGATMPLAVTSVQRERYGTRHRAAIGITEQTDAIAIVVSEEQGSVSLVERGVVRRVIDEERLLRLLTGLLHSTDRTGGGRGPAAMRGVRRLGSRTMAASRASRGSASPRGAPPGAAPPGAASTPPGSVGSGASQSGRAE
jgi:diadenylate cyclase